MYFIIASFRSRTQAAKFENLLKRNRIDCSLINTPREISVGCGVSVKFSESKFNAVKRLMQSADLTSFSGFFRVLNFNYGRYNLEKI